MSDDADLYDDDETPADPQPPQDLAAERAVLGAVLQSPAALNEVLGQVTAGDFYQPAHGTIWDTICRVRADEEPVDSVIVAHRLDDEGQLTRIGGGPYLHRLINEVPTAVNVLYYLQIVIEKSRLRTLREMGLRTVHLAESGGTGSDADDVVEMIRRDVAVATADRNAGQAAHAATVADEFMASLDEPLTGIVGTPWPELDDMTLGGFRPGELVYIAARPGIGKTAVGLNLARSAAQAGCPTVVFSLEMSRSALMERLVSDVGAVPLDQIRRRALDPQEWDRAKRAADRIGELPLWLDDSAGLSVARISARCDQLPARPGLIVVDYLGLVDPADRRAPRQEQVAGISRAFKRLAGDRDIPVVVLHQLNRGSENRAGKRPEMSDLRESGQLEQDADIIILLWRAREKPHEMTMLLEKQRQGQTGELALRYEGRYTRVTSNW